MVNVRDLPARQRSPPADVPRGVRFSVQPPEGFGLRAICFPDGSDEGVASLVQPASSVPESVRLEGDFAKAAIAFSDDSVWRDVLVSSDIRFLWPELLITLLPLP